MRACVRWGVVLAFAGGMGVLGHLPAENGAVRIGVRVGNVRLQVGGFAVLLLLTVWAAGGRSE